MTQGPDEQWVLHTQILQPVTESGEETWQMINLLASVETTADWNRRFWELFPREEPEFAKVARGPGIVVSIQRSVSRASGALSGGVADDMLPLPPNGYEWIPNNGGALLPDLRSFRLWNPTFGYMPRAE